MGYFGLLWAGLVFRLISGLVVYCGIDLGFGILRGLAVWWFGWVWWFREGWFWVGVGGSGCEVGVSPVGKIGWLLALADF